MDKLNIYDFDGTLYKSDSSVDFCFYVYKQKPLRLRFMFIQAFFFIPYKLGLISTLAYKNIFFCFLNGLREEHVQNLVDSFWANQDDSVFHSQLIGEIHNPKTQELSVCISASPQILLNNKTKSIGIHKLIATQMIYNKGKWVIKENCRGKEKISRLNNEFENPIITNAYSDNKDDLDLLQKAKSGYVVKYHSKKWTIKKIQH